MKKVFISQPINDKTIEEINKTRAEIVSYLESQNYEVINKKFTDELDMENSSPYPNLKIIGKNIYRMSECEAIYCAQGWSMSKNCRIERLTALLYNIEILEEKEENKTEE